MVWSFITFVKKTLMESFLVYKTFLPEIQFITFSFALYSKSPPLPFIQYESESGDEMLALIRGGVEVTSSRDLPLVLSFLRYRGSRPVGCSINHPLTDIPIDKSMNATFRYISRAEIAKILGINIGSSYHFSMFSLE